MTIYYVKQKIDKPESHSILRKCVYSKANGRKHSVDSGCESHDAKGGEATSLHRIAEGSSNTGELTKPKKATGSTWKEKRLNPYNVPPRTLQQLVKLTPRRSRLPIVYILKQTIPIDTGVGPRGSWPGQL